jgi:endonuclease/exonuclease/phosphatase family metal-dependent hydrolase
MRFTICWWNTGLAPPKGATNDPDHLRIVVDAIHMLMMSRDVDLLCLGEVDSETMAAVSGMSNSDRFTFIDRSRDSTGTKFNMGFVHSRNRVAVGASKYHAQMFEQTKRKMAQNFELTLSDGSAFDIFVVHWPSRLFLPPEAITRPMLGFALRQSIDSILDADPDRKIIVLGDFNDEPYDTSIARMLSATREIAMVRANRRLLYNPFWRSLVGADRYGIKAKTPGYSPGTYYYSSGRIHRWRVFDQILLSSSLLGGGNWHLSEDETVIWEDASLLGVGPGLSKNVDHLPVFAVLEKDMQDD